MSVNGLKNQPMKDGIVKVCKGLTSARPRGLSGAASSGVATPG